ncbi:excinuclease ABC subunit A [Methylobacillus gramineus]|uniref:excinuclease ABC subunit A n=1 Tax=Methylobacillus gramineus TaxID=755169 RepID=UPI001CFF8366|nr:excinuclease ABC subunit A [Methylobacillus gramineus]MCB5183720.1 excinuclease ABC subunit A [Methylobacillus gramineus]
MKNILNTALLITILFASSQAMARDDQKMHSLEDALNSAAAKEKLDPEIKLFFGNQTHPAVAKTLGEWKTNKKTNGFNKSDKEACEWTLLSALLELQDRASKEGGNAVINIKSNYKNKETSSETEYMCGSGALMSGVALKGDVVKLK